MSSKVVIVFVLFQLLTPFSYGGDENVKNKTGEKCRKILTLNRDKSGQSTSRPQASSEERTTSQTSGARPQAQAASSSESDIEYRNMLSKEIPQLIRANKFQEAQAKLNEALTAFPKNNIFYSQQGNLYYRKGMLEEALKVALHALSLKPKDPRTLGLLANIYEARKEYDKAIEFEKKILSITSSNNVFAWTKLTRLYLMIGDFDSALEAAHRAYELDKNDVKSISQLIKTLMAKEEYEKAYEYINQALIIAPKDPILWLYLTRYYLATGNLSDALRIAKQNWDLAISKVKTNKSIMSTGTQLAQIYFKMGELEEALAIIEEILSKEPEDIRALSIASKIYKSLGMFEKALEKSNDILTINANDIETLNFVSSIHLAMHSKDLSEARSAVEKVLNLDPKNFKALLNKTRILLVQRHYAEALAQAKILNSVNPKAKVVWAILTQIYLARDEIDNAISTANKLIELDSKNIFGWGLLTKAYLAKQDYIKAHSTADKNIENAKTTEQIVVAKVLMAKVLIAQKNYDEATKIIAQALSISPNNQAAIWLSAKIDREERNLADCKRKLLRLIGMENPNIQVVAALYTILDKNNSQDRSQLEMIKGYYTESDWNHILAYAKSFDWNRFSTEDFLHQSSIQNNPFWEGLNDVPVNSKAVYDVFKPEQDFNWNN